MLVYKGIRLMITMLRLRLRAPVKLSLRLVTKLTHLLTWLRGPLTVDMYLCWCPAVTDVKD